MCIETIGRHLGYPQCCIDSFFETRGALGNRKGAKAGRGTGYIPCPKCADKVLSGEVSLGELIVDREHIYPFPNASHDLLKRLP